MPRSRLSHPVCLQRPYACPLVPLRPEIVSRDPQLRSARVLRFGLASLGRLMGSAAEKLSDSMRAMRFAHRGWLLGVDFVHVSRTFNERFNVELWPLPAHGSRTGIRAACLVGLKSNGGRARTR